MCKRKLDKYQLKAIKSKRKTILLLAGAGCGKTYTIVNKVRYMIENLGVKKEEIVCISFTNDSVNKLKKDLSDDKIEVLTFHKLALKIIGMQKDVLTEDMLTDVIIDSFSNNTLLGLYKMSKEDMVNLIKTFINLFKSNNYDIDRFYTFINKAKDKEKYLLKEIMKCYICYETYLNKENIIDFNDMINLAIEKLDISKITYKYIIIDEYQDISHSKLMLVKKLVKLSNAHLFLVGDDFQSIYRFTGSNINVITHIRRYFPLVMVIKLRRTYRNSKELIKIAGKFIMKNPYQIRKSLISNIRCHNPVEIVYYNDLNYEINKIISHDDIDDLLILSRNNKDLENLNIKNIKYNKMSVHKSKGLEAKYVFLINVNAQANGFPNRYVDHEVLRYVNNYREYYPYEEERRLFYVALTRCIKKIYIFTCKDNESIFIKEIKKYSNVIVKNEIID